MPSSCSWKKDWFLRWERFRTEELWRRTLCAGLLPVQTFGFGKQVLNPATQMPSILQLRCWSLQENNFFSLASSVTSFSPVTSLVLLLETVPPQVISLLLSKDTHFALQSSMIPFPVRVNDSIFTWSVQHHPFKHRCSPFIAIEHSHPCLISVQVLLPTKTKPSLSSLTHKLR